MIRYEFKIPEDIHWNALWEAIALVENMEIEYPYDVDKFLKKYNGKTYLDEGYIVLKVIKGIEFKTEEDLLVFKLKFN